jgi:hypothetical protein
MKPSTKKRLIRGAVILAVVLGALGFFVWHKFFRTEPERAFENADEQFKYGSVGGEGEAGIPYWIWVVLPRVFPEYLPGAGGYKAFGVVWEDGHELPVGFTKRTIGLPRVGNNCALCHVATYRKTLDDTPTPVVGAPANALRIQELLRFLTQVARDPRFTGSTLVDEIERETDLSFIDRLLYRFVIVPATRKALIEQGDKLKWMDPNPAWGPGRDDAFNLPKYMVASLPVDGTTGQCDFNSLWNMGARSGNGRLMNWGGETPALKSIVVDSSLGVGARPGDEFDAHASRLEAYMIALKAPKYPFDVDAGLAEKGRASYTRHCAECHDPGQPKTNTVIGLSEIGTDPERERTWSQQAADGFNAAVKKMGFERPPVVKNKGYYSPPLDGIWMRAPYLHNGSVPSLRDLLEPPKNRPPVFYRGLDLFDPVRVGFVVDPKLAKQDGWLHDTTRRGDGNQGHTYGTELPPEEKQALLEYLKTL